LENKTGNSPKKLSCFKSRGQSHAKKKSHASGGITAGALVAWTGSNYPDLIIGTIVGGIVLNGARRILALKG